MTIERISETERAQLLEAIERAGDFLLSLWPGKDSSRADLGVQTKVDGTQVSRADIGSNEILMKALATLFPNDAVLSEEVEADTSALSRASRTWVIDPLDGTKAFLNGTDQFSILVALCERAIPTLGFMLFPARKELVVAEQGRGATLNGAPLSVSTHVPLRAGSVYIRNFESRRPELACPMMDSGLALRMVAKGELDGAIIRMNVLREWDVASPIVAITEAGGRVTDERGASVLCGLGTLQIQYLIASNGVCHEELLSLIP